MPTWLEQIEKRHNERRNIFEDSLEIRPPLITSSESVKDARKVLSDTQTSFLDSCFLVTQDVTVLLSALSEACSFSHLIIEDVVHRAWEKHNSKLTQQEIDVLYKREVEEAEKRLEEAKKKGEVPGQMKMSFKDDGSVAEAAGPCETVSPGGLKK